MTILPIYVNTSNQKITFLKTLINWKLTLNPISGKFFLIVFPIRSHCNRRSHKIWVCFETIFLFIFAFYISIISFQKKLHISCAFCISKIYCSSFQGLSITVKKYSFIKVVKIIFAVNFIVHFGKKLPRII